MVRVEVRVTVSCVISQLRYCCVHAQLPIWSSGRVCNRQAKYADWPNKLDLTGYESGMGCKIRSGAYAIRLISWAASEVSTVSPLICDCWLTRKLAMFTSSTGVLDSADNIWLRLWGWTYSKPARRELGPSLSPVGLELQRTSEKGAGGGVLQHRPSACHAVQ